MTRIVLHKDRAYITEDEKSVTVTPKKNIGEMLSGKKYRLTARTLPHLIELYSKKIYRMYIDKPDLKKDFSIENDAILIKKLSLKKLKEMALIDRIPCYFLFDGFLYHVPGKQINDYLRQRADRVKRINKAKRND